jgi:hypothetical protein
VSCLQVQQEEDGSVCEPSTPQPHQPTAATCTATRDCCSCPRRAARRGLMGGAPSSPSGRQGGGYGWGWEEECQACPADSDVQCGGVPEDQGLGMVPGHQPVQVAEQGGRACLSAEWAPRTGCASFDSPQGSCTGNNFISLNTMCTRLLNACLPAPA